jgi:glycosyltransferase involved in cell wall biosynthesis
MRVLLLAPQPFYQERGTPIAVHLLLQALSRQGHQVDALVYPEGADRTYPGVRLFRAPRWLGVRGVGPGPSWKKLLADVPFAVAALWLARRRRYDLVHAIEESVFLARLLKRLSGVPYLYDMDSGMAEQLLGKYPALRPIAGLLRGLEASAARGAEVVVPVCDALAQTAQAYGARRITVLRDVSMLSAPANGRAPRPSFREAKGLTGPVVMYVGNLEWYQGIDLLLEGMARARRRVPSAQLVIIGGDPKRIARYQQRAHALGLDGGVRFLGPWPLSDLGYCLDAADVLVSPRRQGGNTPMKIYSYLDSGKPVLATNLPTHTQVLTDDVAVLAAPTGEAIGQGLVRLLEQPEAGRRLGVQAKALVARQYSYPVFEATLRGIYDALSARGGAR